MLYKYCWINTSFSFVTICFFSSFRVMPDVSEPFVKSVCCTFCNHAYLSLLTVWKAAFSIKFSVPCVSLSQDSMVDTVGLIWIGNLPKSPNSNVYYMHIWLSQLHILDICYKRFLSPSDETSKFVLSSDISITIGLIFFIFGIFMVSNRTHILVNLFDRDPKLWHWITLNVLK